MKVKEKLFFIVAIVGITALSVEYSGSKIHAQGTSGYSPELIICTDDEGWMSSFGNSCTPTTFGTCIPNGCPPCDPQE